MGTILVVFFPINTESPPKLNSDGISEEVVKHFFDEAGEIKTDVKKGPNLEFAPENEEVQPFLPSNKWYRNKKLNFILKHVAALIYFCIIMYIMYYILDMAFGPKTWRDKKKNVIPLAMNS